MQYTELAGGGRGGVVVGGVNQSIGGSRHCWIWVISEDMRRGVQTERATLLVREKRSLRKRERERDSHSFACRAFKLSDAIKSTSFLSPTHFVLPPIPTYYTDTSSLGATSTTPGQRPPLPTTGAISKVSLLLPTMLLWTITILPL